MNKTIWIATVILLLSVTPSKSYAQEDTATSDNASATMDSLSKMTSAERDANYDSIYWSRHPKTELVWNTDTGKTVKPPVRQNNEFDYSNSYVPNSVPVSTSKAIGQIDIQSGMSPSGGRTYTVPIKAYKLDGVFCPDISLSYNSQGGGSAYGKGWSIGGLQTIIRGNKNIYYDGKTEGMNMNANDAFYLNGIRLVRISGYQYESEQGNIKAVATVDGNVVKYFNVYYPNGYTAVFGMTTTTSNKLEYPITSLTDLRGRSISYGYISYYNTYNISYITYDNGNARISFTYDQTRADYVQGYRGGLQTDSKYLLKGIACTRNSSEIGTYTLTYTTDANTSLLQKIDYSANGSSLNPLKFYYGDGSAISSYYVDTTNLGGGYSYQDRAAMTAARGRFNYHNGNDGIAFYPNINPYFYIHEDPSLFGHSKNYYRNMYNDHANDYIFIYEGLQDNVNNPVQLTLGTGFITLLTADLDGNQQESIIKVKNEVNGNNDVVTFTVYWKTNYGISQRYVRTYSYPTVHIDNDNNKSIKPKFYYTGDFNGDGKIDVMAISAANPFGETNNPSTCYIYDLNNGTTLYSGNLFNFNKQFESIGLVYQNSLAAENLSDKVIPLDYNGDGKTDICHINPNGMTIYTFSQSGSTITAQQVATYSGLYRQLLQNKFYSPGDFNGDGLMDIIVSSSKDEYGSSYWTIHSSKGDGTFSTSVSSQGPNTTNTSSDFFVQDIDSDGLTDLVELTNTSFKGYMVKNNNMALGATQSLNHTNELIVPVSIYSSSLSTQFVSLLGTDATLYSYKTNRRTDQALTGMASSTGTVEKNYYFAIANESLGIYTKGYYAVFPYSNIFEAIPVLAGEELYLGGVSADKNYYRYTNAVVHRQGLGFCGFEKIEAQNKRGQISKTIYEPYNHSLLKQTDTPTATITYDNSVTVDTYKRLKALVTSREDYDKLRGITGTTEYTYDSYGQVLTESTSLPGSISINKSYSYTNFTNISSKYHLGRLSSTSTATTRGNSQHTEQTNITSYNDNDQPMTVVNKTNGVTVQTTTMAYDTYGNMTSKSIKPYSSQTARTFTYQYATGNRMTKETDPLGVWKSYSYNTDGTVSSTGSYVGSTDYTYDAFGRVVTESLPDGTVNNTAFSWDSSNGGLYAITKSGTSIPTTSVIYDALNREVRLTETRFDGNTLKVDKGYDTYGDLTQESYPYKSGSPTYKQYSYDAYHRLTEKYEAGKTTSYSYSGTNTTVSDGTLSSTSTTDALGGLVSVTDQAGTVTYTLNGAGNPVSISAPGGTNNITTTIGYDVYGRRTSITDPSHGNTTFTYHNTEGYLKSETNANSQTTNYTCDVHGRVTRKSSPEFYTDYTYNDNLNKITAETSSNGTSATYSYDALGRLSSVRENAVDSKWLQRDFTYSSGKVSAIKYTSQNGVLTTENYYYTNGHLTSVKLNGTTSIFNITSEDNQGRVAYMGTGGISRNYSYTISGYPVSRAVTAFGPTKQSIQYSFNGQTGNLTSRSYPLVNKTENFTYDNLHRLTGFGNNSVEYGNNGNITLKDDVGSFAYNTSGKPYAVSSVTLTNSISVGTQNVSYYSFDRPNTISDNGYTASFTYNGNFDRVKMQMLHNSQAYLTRYYLGGCYELDVKPSGTTEKLYLNGGYYDSPTVLIKQGNSSSVYQILRDHLGSITHVLNSSGTVVQELSYNAWGRLRNPSTFALYTPTNEPELYLGRGYCGHEHLTGLGLINMNARLYDPLLGRFLSPDPYVQAPEFSQSFNRYSYCMNNPLIYKDENGEFFIGTFFAAITDAIANVFKHGFNVSQYNWTKTLNAWRIDIGMFRGSFGQIVNKWTWGIFNSFIGNELAQGLNIAGKVRNVTYFDGMLALDGVTKNGAAFTIGHYSFGPKGYKATWRDHLFVHEYGHYMQSQLFGPFYIGVVAIPSALNANGILPGDHKYRWYEVDASRRAAYYFDKKYGRGNKKYDSNKPDNFFDINSFILGGNSPYINPRKGSTYQGKDNPISGGRVSIWEILVSFLTI